MTRVVTRKMITIVQDIYIVLDEDGDGTYDDGEAASASCCCLIPDHWSGLSTDGLDEGDYTVYAYQNASLNDGADLTRTQVSRRPSLLTTLPASRKATFTT